MDIAKKYVEGLKKAHFDIGYGNYWEHFEKIVHGAGKEDIKKLREAYPDVPNSLVQLLEIMDGTYYREYAGDKIIFYVLGSDEDESPYCLLSVAQMLKAKEKEELDWLEGYLNREYEVEIDEKIINNAEYMCWLPLSGDNFASQLFIDFSPSGQGTKGQIVRFTHDPDELVVIAEDFDDYLEMLMDREFDFVNEENMDSYEY